MNNEQLLKEAVRHALNAINQIPNTKLNGADGFTKTYGVCSYLETIIKETATRERHGVNGIYIVEETPYHWRVSSILDATGEDVRKFSTKAEAIAYCNNGGQP